LVKDDRKDAKNAKVKKLTYLKLSGLHLGFMVNWNVAIIKYGIKRMVNQLGQEDK